MFGEEDDDGLLFRWPNFTFFLSGLLVTFVVVVIVVIVVVVAAA